MFEPNGNLKAGLHDWTIEEIKDRLVSKFPTSATRPTIMAGFEQLRSEMVGLANVKAPGNDPSSET